MFVWCVYSSYGQSSKPTNFLPDSLFKAIEKLSEKERAEKFIEIASDRSFTLNDRILLADSAITLIQILHDDNLAYKAFSAKARLLSQIQKYEQALEAMESVKKYIKKGELDKKAEVEIATGQLMTSLGRKDTAEILIKKGLETMLLLQDSALISKAYFNMGNFYMRFSNYAMAIENYQKALGFNKSTQSETVYSGCYLNMGLCFKYISDFETSLKYLFSAMEFTEPGSSDAGRIFNSIGNIYAGLKLHEKSLEFFFKAKDLFEHSRDTVMLAVIYQNIGASYYNLHKNQNSILCYKKAIDLMKTAGYLAQQIPVLISMASLYNENGQPDSALYFITIAEKLLIKYPDKRNEACIAERKAGVFLIKGNNSKALQHYNDMISLAGEINELTLLKAGYEHLYEFYRERGDTRSALNYFQQYITLKDSIESSDFKVKVEEIVTKYQVEAKEKENKILQQELLIKKQQISRQKAVNLIIIALAGILFILLLFAYYFVRLRNRALFQSRETNKANLKVMEQQLKIREQEKLLADEKARILNIELNHQVDRAGKTTSVILKNSEITSRLLDNISELKSHCDTEGSQLIMSTLAEFSGFTADNNWENFYSDFSNLHKDFFQKLEKLETDFTENEKRIAAFIKMDFRPKDIAAITFQSANTINVTKNRLRKKLNLETTDELNVLLQSL